MQDNSIFAGIKNLNFKLKVDMIKKMTLLLFCILSFYTGYSQIIIDYSSPKEYTIADINVSGIKYSNAGVLVQISGLSVGQKITVPGDDITNAVKKLWKQKLFSDIKINAEKIKGDKIWLNIYLKEEERLSVINFIGTKKSEEDDLREQIKLIRGSQVNKNSIINLENIIKEYYAEKGFARTEVKTLKRKDTTIQNAVILDVHVNKHKKTRIELITITGNIIFTERNIKWKKLKETKEKRFFGVIKPSKYIIENYEEDKKNLIAEYSKEGYRDAKIVYDSIINFEENDIKIIIKIDEGKQYFFRNIKWIGNTKYKTETLNELLKIKKGDVFDKEHLENRLSIDEDAVGNLYMDRGYLFFNVNPVEVRIDGDSVDVELQMYEGEKAEISKVQISGNTRTNDPVIRREIRTRPGDLFSRRAIIRSVRELATLGHFDTEHIIPNPIPNQQDGTVNIGYSLVERGNDRVEISGGWGQGMLIGTLGLTFSNFSTKNFFDKKSWSPLPTGDGQQLSLRAQTNGTSYQAYSVSFVEPWLGGKKPNSLSVSGFYNLQSNGYEKTAEKRADMIIKGVAFGFGRRLKKPDDFFTLYNELSLQNYTLNDWTYFKLLNNGSANSFSFKTIFGRNSIDNPLYSRNGSKFSIGLELTPPYSLFNNKNYTDITDAERYKWLEFHKWTFENSWFMQITGDLVLHSKIKFGYLGYYNKFVGPTPFGGFSLGGDGMGYYSYGTDIIGLRGYENGSLTPELGGNVYDKYTVELRYPVVLSQSATIYGLVFAEAGNSWFDVKKFNPFDLYRSAGAGVRIFLPMLGLLGFDWGYGFDEIPGNPSASGSQFHFVMGEQF